MMQGIFEGIFDACYLVTAIVVGLILLVKGKSLYIKLFGIMAISLSLGDAFHLVPRVYSLLGSGLENNLFALGLGKLITSVTMTGFYVILYFIIELRSQKKSPLLRYIIFALAAVRIFLCCFPQNEWFIANPSILWGVLRNIPFAAIGIITIVLSFVQWKEKNDRDYLYMAIAIILSFAFYVPVVLLAGTYPLVGTLMIPKTLAYVWIVFIGFKHFLEEEKLVL